MAILFPIPAFSKMGCASLCKGRSGGIFRSLAPSIMARHECLWFCQAVYGILTIHDFAASDGRKIIALRLSLQRLRRVKDR